MIAPLLTLAGPGPAHDMRHALVWLVAEALLTALAFLTLVPILTAFLAGDMTRAWAWVGVLAALAAAYGWARFRSQIAGYDAAMTAAEGLFERLGAHLARMPLGWFGPARTGPVAQLTGQGVIDVMGVPAHLWRPIISAFVTPALIVAGIAMLDWQIALAALAAAPVLFVINRWLGARVMRSDRRMDTAMSEAAGRAVEFARAQAVLRAHGLASVPPALDAAIAETRTAGRAQILTAVPAFISFVLAVQLAFTAIFALAVWQIAGGRAEAVPTVALLIVAVRFAEPLVQAADLSGALRVARNALNRMAALLATPPLPEPVSPAIPRDTTIAFHDVSFSYDGNPVLWGADFWLPERGLVALVGPSGAGKTTILRLIARFWDVEAGRITMGGEDLRSLGSETVMARLALVFQDVYLFEGTIRDNILMGRPNATDDDVDRAVRLARVDEIVARIPGGLDARVGEGGARLSGGERQRVSIARALLKDAPILLLDEATAALDALTQRAVEDMIATLAQDRLVVVVAHRLVTIRAARTILFLDEGRVVEQGNHQTLLEAGGRYAAFWNVRAKAGGWRVAPSAPEGQMP
jgi:ATP-binding cassette, subfamily B, bacterial IrtB/YbtQ